MAGATGRVDILYDIANEAFGEGTPDYNDFLFGSADGTTKGFEEIIQPDCPLTLNGLYGLFKAGATTEGNLVKNFANNVFSQAKNAIVISAFLSTFVVLLTILILSYRNRLISVWFFVITLIVYLAAFFLVVWLYNPKLSNTVNKSVSGTLSTGLPILTSAQYIDIYNSYVSTMNQVRQQVCQTA